MNESSDFPHMLASTCHLTFYHLIFTIWLLHYSYPLGCLFVVWIWISLMIRFCLFLPRYSLSLSSPRIKLTQLFKKRMFSHNQSLSLLKSKCKGTCRNSWKNRLMGKVYFGEENFWNPSIEGVFRTNIEAGVGGFQNYCHESNVTVQFICSFREYPPCSQPKGLMGNTPINGS